MSAGPDLLVIGAGACGLAGAIAAHDAGISVAIVEKETPAVAVSFGFPIDLKRGDPDWLALWRELAELQEACSLPVATTTMGKGTVSERHPLSVGIVGYYTMVSLFLNIDEYPLPDGIEIELQPLP